MPGLQIRLQRIKVLAAPRHEHELFRHRRQLTGEFGSQTRRGPGD
jgi:hypothetical protein